jgi:hypothetical protein
LLGITWSGAQTFDAGGAEELREINPQTGTSTLIHAIPGMDWLSGAQVADPARGVIYVVAYGNLDSRPRLFSIDTTTGATLANPVLDGADAGGYNWSGGLHLRPDGGLVGLTWSGGFDGGVEQLRTIDPATGATTFVGAAAGIYYLLNEANTSDPQRTTLYAVAESQTDFWPRLFSVGLATGQVLASPVLDAGSVEATPLALFTRANGSLITVASIGAGDAGTRLATINPASGAMTLAGSLPLEGIRSGASAIDRAADRFVVLSDSLSSSTLKLVTVNAATGAVISSPDVAPNAQNQPYNWSGGLFFVP